MPWTNPETADIVYPDIDSRLTSLFCDAGYLDEATWESATPTYYLEVKTAVGKCDERLFMSNKQYEMVCAAIVLYRVALLTLGFCFAPDEGYEAAARDKRTQGLCNLSSVSRRLKGDRMEVVLCSEGKGGEA